jgi:hypothetical protein
MISPFDRQCVGAASLIDTEATLNVDRAGA